MILRGVSTFTLGLVLLCGSGLSASAACYAPDQQLPAQAVTDFLGGSSQLLQEPKNAQGGAEMISYVRDLVASNPATLPADHRADCERQPGSADRDRYRPRAGRGLVPSAGSHIRRRYSDTVS